MIRRLIALGIASLSVAGSLAGPPTAVQAVPVAVTVPAAAPATTPGPSPSPSPVGTAATPPAGPVSSPSPPTTGLPGLGTAGGAPFVRPPSATPALVAALDARLDRLRLTYGIPGMSVVDRLRRRLGLAWPIRSGRRGGPSPGHHRHRVLGGQRVQDVHGRADHAARRGRPADPRDPGEDRSCRPSGSTRRSRSASCSTTPAGCVTSTSTRASTRRCSPSAGRSGTRRARSAMSASPSPGPGRHGTTRTRTTSCWACSPRPSGGPPGRPAAHALLRAARARPHLVPVGRGAQGAGRARLPLHRQGPQAARDRPVGRLAGGPVHLGHHRVRRRGLDRHLGGRPRPLGRRAVRRERPQRRRRAPR